MNCPRCQAETPPGAAFCPECGDRLTTVYYGSRHKFCPACGRLLAPSSAEPSPPDALPPDTGFIGKRP